MPGADPRRLFDEAVAHHQAGRLDEAVGFYRRLLATMPDLAAANINLATALCDLGRPQEAEASYRRALAIDPTNAQAHNNLGTLLYDAGRLDDAVASYRAALALEPDYAEALSNLGTALWEQGKLALAEASFRHALAVAPAFPGAADKLGMLLKDQGRLEEAKSIYRQSLDQNPDDAGALCGLAEVLAAGDEGAALTVIRQALAITQTARAKRAFVDIVAPLRWAGDEPWLRAVLVRALTEPWARPALLARTSASLVKQGKTGALVARAVQAWPASLPELSGAGAELAQDALLCALLTAVQNTDIELERFLTLARRALLQAGGDDDAGESALEFFAALAGQCFINEYVFAQSDAETAQAWQLRDALSAALAAGRPVRARTLLAVAAYFPLSSLSGATRLLEMPWPASLAAVLAQQLREPREEAQLHAAIPNLTSIQDGVSRRVQSQYEENPYPRWLRIPPAEKANTVTGYLRGKFPLADFHAGSGGEIAQFLSVGCGTGLTAIEIACAIKCQLLAMDLSLSSLAYAARQARALGLANITFAQGDLLALGGIGRQFDVIECSGVLHHLADPFAGWRVLLPLLKPGGFMALGLYSEAARQDVVAARRFIAERGYGPTPEDIRRSRQDLLALEGPARGVASAGDFFGVSSCRDLLFHVQEHRLTLAAIAAFLKENGLIFLGFETGAATLAAYRRRFPSDPAAVNLDHWQTFEADHPQTFSGMYMFWVQKTF